MKRTIITILAGIFTIPAFFCFAQTDMTEYRDQLTTPVLNDISLYPWIESRHYDSMDKPSVFNTMRRDFLFDAWLADKARSKGVSLDENKENLIEKISRQIQYKFLLENLVDKEIEVTKEELERAEDIWCTTQPPKWEVFYIFIDATEAETEKEKAAIKKKAENIREKLTKENFSKMARLWSDAPGSANGGYLGNIEISNLGPTFQSHIRKTKPGTIGGPYSTASGWNIFFVKSYTPEKTREISEDKLREMTARVKADSLLIEARDNEEEWNSLLYRHGIMNDPEYLTQKKILKNFLLSTEYIDRKMDDKRPSEKDLKEIYEEKKDIFVKPPSRRAREIFITSENWSTGKSRRDWIARREVRNKAREIREKILEGADFARMAADYSESKTAQEGGDLGWIQEPSSYIYDRTLSRLEPGEVSPPVATDKGYMLFQLLDIKKDVPMTFEEARKHCRNIWRKRQKDRLLEKLRKKFRKSVDIST